MIELISYQGLNGLKFGDSIERANQLFGAPLTERKSKGGEIVQHRKGFILRFSSPDKAFSEGVVPCGENVMLDRTLIDWSSEGLSLLCREDGNSLEYFGSVVLFSKGVALSGLENDMESERAIAVFANGVWDSLKNQMNIYQT